MSGMRPDYTIIKGDEHQILNAVAWDIADRITIFGNWPPKEDRERLGMGEQFKQRFKSYSFKGGAMKLSHHFYEGSDRYENLAVRTSELNRLLRELAEENA